MDKYEYLTSKDLGVKPSTVAQAKFKYSSLGKAFTEKASEKKMVSLIIISLKN